MKKKNKILDETLEDFPSNQTFELAVLDGCVNGNFMVGDSISNYFADAMQPIKFVTADSIDSEFDKVLIRVGTDLSSFMRPLGKIKGEEEKDGIERESRLDTLRAGFEKMIAEKKAEAEAEKKEGEGENEPLAPVVPLCYPYGSNKESNWQGFASVRDESIEIMLGETKYFAVKKKEVNGVVEKIEIVEIETDYGVEPVFPASAGEGWTWVKQNDVWPSEPVEKIEGEELGVYWEKEKPVWNGNTKNGNLEKGIIRLVGRYWEEGKTFKVELKTSRIGETEASVKIKVKKPSKLLTNDSDPSYRWSKDIRNNNLDIDNYLIEKGGKYGIPPQLLKGQLFEEAYHKENESFWPSYRYEPWSDLRFRKGEFKEDFKKQPYWVNENGMGVENGGEPVQIDHQNVRPNLNFSTPTPYPNSPMEIGVYVADNLEEYYAGKHLNRKFNGPPMYGPSKLQKTWDFLIQYYSTHGNGDPEFQADYLIRIYLKQTYKDTAQTRKSASYGYFQMLYTTAILKEPKGPNYPRWPGNYLAPEKLNDQDISTPYVMNHLKNNIIRVLKNTSKTFDQNDWTNGFEQVWFDSYHLYNDRSDYDDKVFIFSKKFLPR